MALHYHIQKSDDHKDCRFFNARISILKGGERMSENTIITESRVIYPMLAVPIGNTTYMVGIHFNEATKETLDDKLKRLLKKEIQQMKTAS